MNLAQAFSAYEAVRHRLPAIQRRGACAVLRDLEALADQVDVFLLDAFGVLNIGETAIAGVPDRVRRLQQAGKRVLVVSNAAGLPHAALMAKYAALGYEFVPEDVITSRKALLQGLALRPRHQWGLMATPAHGTQDFASAQVTFLAEQRAAYDAADGFLLVGSAAWTSARQDLLQEALIRRPRPVLVGNPDIVAPRESGFSTEPGHYAHQLANCTQADLHFFGKPFGNIFDLVFTRLGDVDRRRVVMVGDSLHTDILGGQAAGVQTALIAGYGFFAQGDVGQHIKASGIYPDYILDRP